MIRRRRLPHFDTPGQTQFIIFRLANSLPPHRTFPSAQVASSGETFLAMDRLLDKAHSGSTYLKIPAIAEVMVSSIEFGVSLGHYQLHSWVIMPNHIHLLVTPKVSLAGLLRSLKTATARRANRILRQTGQPFWQHESYDHIIRNNVEETRIRRYIENNPVKAGLVSLPEDYPWSSANPHTSSNSNSGEMPCLAADS